jgi:hypothetical protein
MTGNVNLIEWEKSISMLRTLVSLMSYSLLSRHVSRNGAAGHLYSIQDFSQITSHFRKVQTYI